MPALLIRAAGWAGALQGMLTRREPRITPEIARLSLRTLTCDCTKAVRELDFRLVPLHDMVADCAAWMKAEGLLPKDPQQRLRDRLTHAT